MNPLSAFLLGLSCTRGADVTAESEAVVATVPCGLEACIDLEASQEDNLRCCRSLYGTEVDDEAHALCLGRAYGLTVGDPSLCWASEKDDSWSVDWFAESTLRCEGGRVYGASVRMSQRGELKQRSGWGADGVCPLPAAR